MYHLRLAVFLLGSLPAAAGVGLGEDRLQYPAARRVDHVDTYFGVRVPDPYRWLEQDVRHSKEVAEWVAAENRVTYRYLEAIPQRERIRRRLTELWNFAQYSSPFKEGGRYYYLKNDGLQNQSVLYVMKSLGGEARAILDPNSWSKDGTIALGGLGFSDDGRYMAFCRAEAGSDWSQWRIMEIQSGRVLPDELRWTKFSQASWTKDGKGFFYSRYEEPAKGAEFQALNFNNKLCYHRVGAPQAADELVYYRPAHREWQYDGEATEDGRYLVITTHLGTDERYRITVKDLAGAGAGPIELVDNFEHEYSFIGNDGPVLYFKTDLDAPRRRLVAVDLRKPERKDWREIIPQAEATLAQVGFVGNELVACYLKDVRSQVKIFSAAGRFLREVRLPGIGTAAGFQGKRTDTETFYVFSSFATPPSIYHYDVATGTSRLFRRAEVRFNPDNFEVKQVFYHSKDGTRVPMFIAHKKGIALDGSNPTLLYGYGGFNISLPPAFSVGRLAWMDMGGVYVQANLRGGGEYGEAWHKAGIKLRKQNVFDDFIAAAQWLIAARYTRPDKLAIQGGSNGGLLVGAVMTQRPDLFGACLPVVGVMDMLRFHKFTEGRTWVDDYGSSDDPDEFKALLRYSPYHNIKPGTCYPPTLITTADTDDRVVPGHSFKFAAALQQAQACGNPVLIRISTRAGHGAGKPTTKRIEETADDWAFLAKNLDMRLPIPLWSERAPVGDGRFETANAYVTVYRPEAAKANGTAVVICPGGGYGGLAIEPEGHGIARWLNRHGIAGIVLEYRLPAGRPWVPLLDAQRAIRTVRFRAKTWHIDPGRIGIMGFSAGGHLASTAATHFDDGNPQTADPIQRVSCRPDFAILIYPVITMGEKTHGGSRASLLGPHPKPELVELFSNEKQVTARTPPAFLAHAKDDTAVVPANSGMFYAALRAHKVPAEYLELPQGGHGLNGYQGPTWDAWQNRSLEWLAAQKLLTE